MWDVFAGQTIIVWIASPPSKDTVLPEEQPPTGSSESRVPTTVGPVSSDASRNETTETGVMVETGGNKMLPASLLKNATQASRSLIAHLPDPSHTGKLALIDEMQGCYTNLLGRLVGVSGVPREVTTKIEQFKSIITIVLGKRLGGVLGQTVTEEGRRRCKAAEDYIPTFHALASNVTLIAGASGHNEEGKMFTAYLKDLLNNRPFNWQSSVNFFTEHCAKNTFENILFSRAEVFRLFNPPPPRLWTISSSDNHLGSLILKDRSLPPAMTELGLLRQDEGDAVAFLFSSYPNRDSGDKGLEWICRMIDAAFLAAPLQANLFGIRDGVPKEAQRDDKEKWVGGKERVRLNQVYEKPVRLLGYLIDRLQHDRAPLTEMEPETQCAYLVSEIRKNIDSVLDPLGRIHVWLESVIGMENGDSFTKWHGVDLENALKWINKLIARVRWFADMEASDADRQRVREQY